MRQLSFSSDLRTRAIATAAIVVCCLLAGCLTRQQMIAKRIAKKSDFFATLPPESQQRIREGHLESGDPRDAAWIVYGSPDRVFKKVTATSTNEVWSYVAQGSADFDESRPVLHPIRTRQGWAMWHETLWAPPPRFDSYEYLRIELDGNRIHAIESEQP